MRRRNDVESPREKRQPKGARSPSWWYAIVVAVALGIRMLFVLDLESSPAASLRVGDARLQQGRFDDAKAHFERALELNPENVRAVTGLAGLYFHRQDLDRAETFYQRALVLAPDNAGAHTNLGVIAAIRGDIDDAIEHFQEALRINPRYGEAKKNLARALAAS